MVVVATTTGPLGSTFVGPLCLLFGFVGLIGLVVALMMRSALIYVAAALAPIVWSVNVLPLFRGSARKLVHLTVALVVSKLAIVDHPRRGGEADRQPGRRSRHRRSVVNDGAAAVGTLMTGFVCFLIAAVTPIVLYKLMPTVEGAMVGAGIAGGWARGATTAAHTALMVKSLGATAAASAATRGVAGQQGVHGAAAVARGGGIAGLTGHQPQQPGASPARQPGPEPGRKPGDGHDRPSPPSRARAVPTRPASTSRPGPHRERTAAPSPARGPRDDDD